MAKLRIVIDTREQTPLPFNPEDAETMPGTLAHGDYSLHGFTDLLTIERKSLPDLVACVGRERERFERELLALRGYHCKAVVIEASLKQIDKGGWRGQVLPQQVRGSIAAWRVRHKLDFIYASTPELAASEVVYILRKYRDTIEDFLKRLKSATTTS